MKTTTNIGLKKPDYTDAVDIAIINGNMDTLDTKIQEVKQQIEDIDVSWSGISGKPSTFPPSSHTHDDRYYTETEIDTKLSGKANSSHTHTKSQISDFPTSLPANGGNADTVDGKHASDFATASHNHDDRYYTESEVDAKFDEVGSYKVHPSITTTNDLPSGKWYNNSDQNPTTDWYYIDCGTNPSNGSFKYQRARYVFADIWYDRIQKDGVWQPWKKIAYASDIPTSLPANGGTASVAHTAYQVAVPPANYDTIPIEIGRHIDFHKAGSSLDYDARLSFEGGSLVFRNNENSAYTMNIPYEINTLKSIASKSVIKSVQRGVAEKGRDITVTISAVNLNKAIVLGGSTDSSGTDYNYHSKARFINSTTIQFTGYSAYQQPWQVIEFN